MDKCFFLDIFLHNITNLTTKNKNIPAKFNPQLAVLILTSLGFSIGFDSCGHMINGFLYSLQIAAFI